MKILKFGGTSVGSSDSIKGVIEIIRKATENEATVAVVFSAMSGVTNQLIEIGKVALTDGQDYLELLKAVEERHFQLLRNLLPVKKQSATSAAIKGLFNELEDILRGVYLIKELTPRTLDLIMSFGERLSTRLMTAVLEASNIPVEYCDARSLVTTDGTFGAAEVNMEITDSRIKEHFKEPRPLQCITGFIASTAKGNTTTLGRGGSDYTASLLGAALDAEVIEIWTDVDGMMTADPRKVPNSFTIPSISFAEAMELSHFGAKVIFPSSLQPAFAKEIPIRILNTFNPDFEGTLIEHRTSDKNYAITGISSIDDIALVNIQGSGMIGVAGISSRLFATLSAHGISVVLISQASSEHSICFAVSPRHAELAKEVLEVAFELEITQHHIDSVVVEKNLSIVAIVGEGMKKSAGVSGKLFSVLGKNGINVKATAQGSSELNISVVIDKNDLSKALNAIHGVFFYSETRSLNLYIVGVGLIGKTLLSQLQKQAAYLKKTKLLTINVIGLANTKKMLLKQEGITLRNDWLNEMMNEGVKTSITAFVERIVMLNLPNSVFIDCTSDKEIVQHYQDLLGASISVVTPNKVANSGLYSEYEKLRKLALAHGVKFLYETNVGAGLPIINTIQGLIDSGDKFLRIEAILSGTLSYIFNTFGADTRFADAVHDAKEKGLTEPDPRDDLSGTDVARKILILAREVGIPLEFDEVRLEQILPDNCLAAHSVQAFFEELDKSDEYFENLLAKATSKNGTLRYIATLEKGKATVELKVVGPDHPFYNLSGSDNVVSFTTERYKDRPLVIKGPGAGAEVTASGVFADIISISSYLA